MLDVVQEEKLQAHALHVGERLLTGLRKLKEHHAMIRDVRGSGLFVGVELVQDQAPATTEAKRIVNRMREEGILLGTDGPFHNVLKIRPPMPFSEQNATQLVTTLDTIL